MPLAFPPAVYKKVCFPTPSTAESIFKLQKQLEHLLRKTFTRGAKIKLSVLERSLNENL